MKEKNTKNSSNPERQEYLDELRKMAKSKDQDDVKLAMKIIEDDEKLTWNEFLNVDLNIKHYIRNKKIYDKVMKDKFDKVWVNWLLED